tara:strand:- start:45 stop:1115 length:1071 start_codon:yes stop_codon:yes gene_type:complete
MADERDLTKVVETPGGSWYEVPASMVREGFADTAEEGLRTLKNLLMGATIGAEQTRTQPVWEEPLNAQEFGEVASMAMAPLAVGGRALLKRIANPIRAFHGSPSTFAPTSRNPLGEFDLSARGGSRIEPKDVGAWLARSPSVARFYAEQHKTDVFHALYDKAMRSGDPLDWQAVRASLDDLPSSGNVYEVDMHVNPENIIRHQEPYYRQPKQVQEALRAIQPDDALPQLSQEQLAGRVGINYLPKNQAQAQSLIDKDLHGLTFSDQITEGLGPTDLTVKDIEGDIPAKLIDPKRYAEDPYYPWELQSRLPAWNSSAYVIWDPEVLDIQKKLAALLAVGGGATAADAFDQTPVEFGR